MLIQLIMYLFWFSANVFASYQLMAMQMFVCDFPFIANWFINFHKTRAHWQWPLIKSSTPQQHGVNVDFARKMPNTIKVKFTITSVLHGAQNRRRTVGDIANIRPTNVMEMHRKCNEMVKNGLNNAANLWLFVFMRRRCCWCAFFSLSHTINGSSKMLRTAHHMLAMV